MTTWALADPAGQPGWVEPRFSTPRDPTRKTTGPAVCKVMRALGWEPMPWQRHAADVIGEVHPPGTVIDGEDVSGLYAHGLTVVSIQRQAGKTTLMLGQAVHRCLAKPRQRVWHTAQTGQDARDKFRELADLVMASPLRQYVASYRKAAGSEGLTFTNGSTLRPHPPTRDGLHGKQSDHNDIDEGWSFDELTGADLFQAIDPTQATRPGAQIVVWSTRGDASSTWFHGLVQRGYDRDGVTLLDWGIPPDADPLDVDTVAAHHPAVGHTITRATLLNARIRLGDKPAEYARAYGNVASGNREALFPAEAWHAARTFEDLPAGRPGYGIAVWEPRNGGEPVGALVAAVADPDGRPVVEVIEHRPGRGWLFDRVMALRDQGAGVAVDRWGPASPVADRLAQAGVELLPLNGTGMAASSQDFWDRICDDAARTDGPRLRHRDHPDLDAAVDVAGRRWIGEGAWLVSSKNSTGDTSCLQAAILAVRSLEHEEQPLTIARPAWT